MASQEDGIYSWEYDSTPNTCWTCTAYDQEGRFAFSNPRDAVHVLVHETCFECDAFKVDESQLCDFCIHIRPSHFMTCRSLPGAGGHDIFGLGGHENLAFRNRYEVVIGTPSELKFGQAGCAFCRWFLEVVQANARLGQHTIDEGKAIRIGRKLFGKHLGFLAYTSGDDDSRQVVYTAHNKEFGKTSAASENEASFKLSQDFSLVSSVVDWTTVTRWKARCEQKHKTCGERAMGKLPHHFRLIDFGNKRVIDADINTPSFFALSYVWGADSEKETSLRQENLSELQKSGSLDDLPQTIADTMRVCKQLDQPYLWVDRLCIVQDDKKDKYGQIRSLEAIYSRAELVIVAACVKNMQSRLAGVDDKFPREHCQISTEVFGFAITNVLQQPLRALYNTEWNKRGWTYQEAILARRKLYFTSTELWFECAEGLQRESTSSADNRHMPPKARRGNHLIAYRSSGVESSGDVFEEYGHHLSQYSRRILTYPSDIYHAFHGIENALYPKNDIIFGLPASDFSRALLWYHESGSEPQERQCSDRDTGLPSWSWASLMGSIQTCQFRSKSVTSTDANEGIFYCSICSWATLAENDLQTLRPINSIHDGKIWKILDKKRRYHEVRTQPTHRQVLALAWARGCIEADVPTNLFQLGPGAGQLQPSFMISAQELALRWPTIQDFWADVQNGKRQSRNSPTPRGLD